MLDNDLVSVSGIICLISSRRIAAAMERLVQIILGGLGLADKGYFGDDACGSWCEDWNSTLEWFAVCLFAVCWHSGGAGISWR